MPSWQEVNQHIKAVGSPYDVVRRKAISDLADYTNRNVIIYYSGWLQKLDAPVTSAFFLNDADKDGFMATSHQLDKTKGLDLVLHTPGGDVAATESLIHYLKAIYPAGIRAVIPQLAMSAGTMIALACDELLLGDHSSLGPIDPQIAGLPAHGILEEFERAKYEISHDLTTIPVWQPIIAKYPPSLIGECEKAVKWANKIVNDSLINGMFKGDGDAIAKAAAIVTDLGDHSLTLSHARHISKKQLIAKGLKITSLEDDKILQDKVLTVHHACILTLQDTNAVKIISNQLNVCFIQNMKYTGE